jgi:hypothetical protein
MAHNKFTAFINKKLFIIIITVLIIGCGFSAFAFSKLSFNTKPIESNSISSTTSSTEVSSSSFSNSISSSSDTSSSVLESSSSSSISSIINQTDGSKCSVSELGEGYIFDKNTNKCSKPLEAEKPKSTQEAVAKKTIKVEEVEGFEDLKIDNKTPTFAKYKDKKEIVLEKLFGYEDAKYNNFKNIKNGERYAIPRYPYLEDIYKKSTNNRFILSGSVTQLYNDDGNYWFVDKIYSFDNSYETIYFEKDLLLTPATRSNFSTVGFNLKNIFWGNDHNTYFTHSGINTDKLDFNNPNIVFKGKVSELFVDKTGLVSNHYIIQSGDLTNVTDSRYVGTKQVQNKELEFLIGGPSIPNMIRMQDKDGVIYVFNYEQLEGATIPYGSVIFSGEVEAQVTQFRVKSVTSLRSK